MISLPPTRTEAELVAEAQDLQLRGDRLGAEALYRQALDQAQEGGAPEAREGLARLLMGDALFGEALQALGDPGPIWTGRMWFLRGQALEATQDPVDAVRAYGQAFGRSEGVIRAAAAARLRTLVDGFPPETLHTLADACLFCPEGGRARLRLARLDLKAGKSGEARRALEQLAADFAGQDLGNEAGALLQGLAAPAVPRAEVPGRYGLLLPLTGALQPFGVRALRGALIGSGLFAGSEDPGIRLEVVDSRGDPERAAQGVEELAGRGVVGIIGPLKGGAAREAGQKARELHVPLIALTPADETGGDWAFRLYLRETDEVARLVDYAVREKGMRRFAILYPDTPQGLRYRDLFWDAVVAQGGEITGVETIPSEAQDVGGAIQRLTGVYALTPAEVRERFMEEERIRLRRERDLLSALGIGANPAAAEEEGSEPLDEGRLKDFKPRPVVDFDAVFLPVASTEAAQIAPQLPFHDVLGVTLLGIRSWNYPTLVQVGEEYVEGAIFPSETHPALPGARAFAAAYREAYGEDPGVIGAYAYDALGLVKAFRSGTEPETRVNLKHYLSTVWAADGATGPLTSHPGGEIAPVPKILTVRRGRIVPAGE